MATAAPSPRTQSRSEHHDVVVIGAGQSGLAAAHHLARRGIDFVVLETNDRVGDHWRNRYDSLLLYSPAKYDELPGMRFAMPPNDYPTGRQMGDYLEAYARDQGLPVRTGIRVTGLAPKPGVDGYVVEAGDLRFEARQVIVANGFFRIPKVPEFAGDLDRGIRQFHADEYRNPTQLADGPVLVVGLSHSGADLAMDAVRAGHPTILAGRGHGQLPFSVDDRIARFAWPLMKFVAFNVLTLQTPIGRKAARKIRKGGAPLLRHRRDDLRRAGIELVPERVTGVEGGRPALAGGRLLDVANVIWCTGYRPDYDLIRVPIFDEDGFPRQRRGVVEEAPGLYFLGVIFQFGFTSMLIVGANRDAAHVVEKLAERAGQSGATRATGLVGSKA